MIEIERKFLVKGEEFITFTMSTQHRCYEISQYYLNESTRIRKEVHSNGEIKYSMTAKSKIPMLSRFEEEVVLPADLGISLFNIFVCAGGGLGNINKTRYLIPHNSLNREVEWEIDVFHCENEGLIIAEIEIPEEHYSIDLFSFIGLEVTGDSRYYNANLALHPYSKWGQEK